ncbi:MAG TPA: bifunctional DNA primase/polymerase [Acidocella sp.]|uniref:bifunctional DNA primase/polymerase n=1 Tax=Acidocella sp. TaxID=50710 RepID=UPI002C148170|nr:bifunctional DNA primase/polymerase [Acidocella sp.]HVE23107.1 bifunctional DNA primase/polymerase [Acidocella sp.]
MTASMPILESALSIAAAGWPVFPCGADKAPVCAGGLKAATTDPTRIKSLFSISKTAMIGMRMGKPSGLIAVDIDPRHGGENWLATHLADLPETRIHSTMSGGVHLLFRAPDVEIRNSASKIAPGVDVRGEGGYIIVPPSPGYSIENPDVDIADLPAWLEALCKPAQAPAPSGAADRPARPAATVDDATPYGRAALDSACNEIRNAPDGAKHDTINRVGFSIGGIVGGGELADAEAFSALSLALADLRPRCADFRAAERTLRRSYDEGRGRPREIPAMQPQLVADLSNIAPFLAKHADANTALQRAATSKPLPVSDEIMNVDGALKMFVDYCNATAISPQPFLALAAGITAIGALAGRKYRTPTNLRSNIYAVGVADSGGGKDHARQRLKDIFGAAGLTQYMGGEDIASGTAMMTALARHPCILFQIDEFGDWLDDVLGPKSTPHRKQIAQRLKTLYSAAGNFVSGTEYADQTKMGRPREDIQQPHACMYGTTTPRQFWKAIAAGSLEDGLLARFLIFVTPESYPDKQRPPHIDPPSDLIEAFKAIAEGADDAPGSELGQLMLATTKPEPVTVPMTTEAVAAYEALDDCQLQRQRKSAGTYVTAIAGRLTENATKLALVKAVSRNPRAPVITGADMAWARTLTEHCVDTLLREASENVADTPYAKNMQTALRLIRKHGPATEYELVRKGWRIPSRERTEILMTLAQSGEVIAVRKEGGTGKGAPATRYSIGAA